MAINLHPYLLLLLPPFLLLLFTFRRLRKPALKLPPGPRPLPIIGNLHIISEFPHLTFHNLYKQYGPLFQVYLGKIPTLIISDADTAGEILKSQDKVFCSHAQTTSLKRFNYGGKDLAFCPFGDNWKLVRRLLNAEFFNQSKVRSFQSCRREEVEALVGTNLELIPFGGGRRVCPGMAHAVANMEIALANILYGFNWELPNGLNRDDIDMSQEPGMTTPKKVPLILMATPIVSK